MADPTVAVPPALMGRLLHLARRLAPSVASASQRASQLAVLWALTAAATGTTQAQLLTGFGLIATFVMISDSGAGTYLLARRSDELTAAAFTRACGVHVAVTGTGVVLCAGFLAVVLERPVEGRTVLILLALGLTQLLDNLSRVVRFPLLNRGHDLSFAWPELTCSVVKIGLAVWAGLSGTMSPLLGLPLISLVVVLLAVRPVRAALHPGPSAPPAVRSILTFGLAGAVNATYSQLPLIFASLILSNAQVAVLATLMRIFLALEIVPGTLMLQMIPLYARGRRTLRRDVLSMAGLAVLLAVVFLPFLPLIGRFLGLPLGIGLGLLFAGSFVAKCGGYILSAFAMGTDQIDVRLRLTWRTALVMLPVVPVLILTLGLPGGALAFLVSEALLAGALARRLRAADAPSTAPGGTPTDPLGGPGAGAGEIDHLHDPRSPDRLPSN